MVSKPVRARRMCDRRKSARVKTEERRVIEKKCVKETKRNRTNKLGHKIRHKGKNRGETTLSTPLVPVYPKGHSRQGDPKAN